MKQQLEGGMGSRRKLFNTEEITAWFLLMGMI